MTSTFQSEGMVDVINYLWKIISILFKKSLQIWTN